MKTLVFFLFVSIGLIGTTNDTISFTLHNSSSESIPLRIPNVMNPNLSPNSDSGVSLAVGQRIIYKYKGKKRILLVVNDSLQGKKLDVVSLIEKRKKEWDRTRA